MCIEKGWLFMWTGGVCYEKVKRRLRPTINNAQINVQKRVDASLGKDIQNNILDSLRSSDCYSCTDQTKFNVIGVESALKFVQLRLFDRFVRIFVSKSENLEFDS
jgi:hypothetical protein